MSLSDAKQMLRAGRILLLAAVLASAEACGAPEASSAGGDAGTEMTRTPPVLVIFMYDRSTSISGG